MKKLISLTCLFLLLDQVSKGLINIFMDLGESITIIPNFFNITYVHNQGAAFSILTGNRLLFIIIALIALNLIYHFFIRGKELDRKDIILYALLISGIIGNMIDRILYGYVMDFLDFTILGYPFAIFNLADAFIVIAIILLLFVSWRKEKCKSIPSN